MRDGDDVNALRAEFQAKDEAYEREFKRINSTMVDMRSDFQSGLRDVFNKLDANANSNRITLPIVLSVIGTVLSVAIVAGVIHGQSLEPFETEDRNLRDRISAVENQLQYEVNSGHNPHALSMRMDLIEKQRPGCVCPP
jgi:hypothetical protein